MIVNLSGEIRLPGILEDVALNKCIDFVRDSVDNAIKNGAKEVSVRSLFGGENYDWCRLGFPIGVLWLILQEKYEDEGYADPEGQAERQAGIYVGHILKYVCNTSSRRFKMRHDFSITYEVV